VSDTKITVSLNGSLKVEGEVSLLDHDGKEIPKAEGKPFWLCRCGA
jgi:CDGSH-type Zn-finger protein